MHRMAYVITSQLNQGVYHHHVYRQYKNGIGECIHSQLFLVNVAKAPLNSSLNHVQGNCRLF